MKVDGKRAEKRSYGFIVRAADVVFQPALTPMEAAMLPAGEPAPEKRRLGALAHAKRAFAPGQKPDAQAAYRLKLRGWGPQRQKI